MPFTTILIAAILLGPAPTTSSEYEATLAEVARLNEAINAGEDVREPLAQALARLPDYAPLLAADPDAREVRTRAQLNLARSHLGVGELERATELMDALLRATQGEPVPVAEFGPSLAALHDDRLAALNEAGTAGIEVACGIPCTVYVDERSASRSVDGLYLGTHRVWITATGAARGSSVWVEQVELTQVGEQYYVPFHVEPEPPPTVAELDTCAPTRARILSRELEITLMTIGGGLVTAGGALLGIADHGASETTLAGAALIGIGAVPLGVGGITLAIDEVPGDRRRRGRQVVLGWRVQF